MFIGHGCAEISGVSRRQVCDDETAGEASSLRYAQSRPVHRELPLRRPLDNREARYHKKKRERIISTIRTGFGTALGNWFLSFFRAEQPMPSDSERST